MDMKINIFFIILTQVFFILLIDYSTINFIQILILLVFYSLFISAMCTLFELMIKNDVMEAIEEVNTKTRYFHPWGIKIDFKINKSIDAKGRTLQKYYHLIKEENQIEINYKVIVSEVSFLYLKFNDGKSFHGMNSLEISKKNDRFLLTFNFNIRQPFLRNLYAGMVIFFLSVWWLCTIIFFMFLIAVF